MIASTPIYARMTLLRDTGGFNEAGFWVYAEAVLPRKHIPESKNPVLETGRAIFGSVTSIPPNRLAMARASAPQPRNSNDREPFDR
jgi:hypothetical protein